MKLLRLIPSNTNIDFLSIKKFAFLFSILVISGTFLSLFLNNLNYGIDNILCFSWFVMLRRR